ncbi:hypothetical protein [Actinomycetospora straminea]|uniref:Nitroreductase family protein n=1 Tax=Actinomycetospora straminea TaxID=663607 RepID=A0ABP9F565_9PSEU|nr:hypothetical protein [Actinomycetospora straminea]MDD7933701.1 hypothetical protein [Actinomycetospora straminea]
MTAPLGAPDLPRPWSAILDEARRYPSPHNSQPITVRVHDDRRADLCYDLDRGLPAESFGIPFAHVCAGVFLESLATVAAAHGWAVREDLHLAPMDFAAEERQHLLGHLELTPVPVTAAAREQWAAFRRRRTSRRPYDRRPVDPRITEEVAAIAVGMGQEFGRTGEQDLVDDLIRINQETLFDDLRDDAVHAEILAWLRTSKRQAAATRDGLSAETMLIPGPLLRIAMRHRWLWDLPVVGGLFRRVYLNTMRGVRELGWLTGPFVGPADHVEAGRCFLRVWLAFTRHGVHLHPFGTVITNPRSHAAFVERTGIEESGGRMAWMLFRYGTGEAPPRSWRRGLEAMLLDRDATAVAR